MLNALTVKKRLQLGFGLILAILVTLTVLAMAKVDVIDSALRENAERNSLIQRYAINFRGSAHDRSIAIRDVTLSTEATERRKEIDTIERLARFYADSARPLEAMIAADKTLPTEVPKLYTDIQAIESRALATTHKIIELSLRDDLDAAKHLLWKDAKPQYVQWLAAINRLIDFEEARIQTETNVARQQAGSFMALMLGLTVLAAAVGIVLALTISGSILRALGAEPTELSQAAKRVASGDLSVVAGSHNAPPGSVLASLGDMQASLASLVGRVRSATDSIATGSAQIATGNADLSQRTEEQASNLQGTAASMERLSHTVKHNADTAQQANHMASSASTAAAKGGEVVSQVVATMQDISASSKKIADIIGVIDGIAFQTNILALNAAVEAARAGEQGRGFAVVASEVRSLAQRSANAAKEIKTLISASVDKVEAGTRLVGGAGQTMDDIVSQVKRVSDLIGEISSATVEQTHGISQVGHAVSQLDQVTQQNAALVEQSAAAAESVKHQASGLAEVVSVFKLGQV